MNKVLVKNQEEVATFKKQRAETCKISGHFGSLDEKVNQLHSDIAEMRMM